MTWLTFHKILSILTELLPFSDLGIFAIKNMVFHVNYKGKHMLGAHLL